LTTRICCQQDTVTNIRVHLPITLWMSVQFVTTRVIAVGRQHRLNPGAHCSMTALFAYPPNLKLTQPIVLRECRIALEDHGIAFGNGGIELGARRRNQRLEGLNVGGKLRPDVAHAQHRI